MSDERDPLNNLHAALIRARAKIKAIPKNGKNPHFGSRYATQGDILGEALPALAAEGLSLSSACRFNPDAGGYELVSSLTHAPSGEARASAFPLGAGSPQNIGAAITYARRYNDSALLEIETDDDDDGNTASGSGQGNAGRAPSRPAAPVPARGVPSDKQGPPMPAAGPHGPQPHGAELNRKGSDCPTCGAVGSVTLNKGGKFPGVYMCKPWEEKGWPGCWAKFTTDPAKRTGNPFKDALAEKPKEPGYGEPAPWTSADEKEAEAVVKDMTEEELPF